MSERNSKKPKKRNKHARKRLTPLMQRYIECIRQGMTQTEAYKAAGYKVPTDPNQLRARVSEVASNPLVRQFMDSIDEELRERTLVTKERIIERLAQIAFADLPEYLNDKGFIDPKKVKTNGKGDIESLDITDKGIKLKTRSAIEAIRELNKMLGYNAPEKHEVSGDGVIFNIDLGDGKNSR